MLTKKELVERAQTITGVKLADLSVRELWELMTVLQHVTDLCLNEVEARGELTFFAGSPIVPYVSEHSVETILTRPNP